MSLAAGGQGLHGGQQGDDWAYRRGDPGEGDGGGRESVSSGGYNHAALTLSDRRCSSSVHQFVSLEVAGRRDPRNDWADGPGGGTNKSVTCHASRADPLRSLTHRPKQSLQFRTAMFVGILTSA
jgi:hypothetical protein